jgi:hypothetical protein
MNTKNRWPRLKLGVHPVLDWVEDHYTTEWLLEVATAVSKNPHPIQARAADGTPAVWDTALEKLLRTLAASPKALDALNHRKPTVPARVLGLNRAVHFYVQRELLGGTKETEKKARGIVADVWRVSDGHVKDDVTDFRAATPTEYRQDDAKRLMDHIVASTMATTTNKSRDDVLKDLAADLCERATTTRA